jgi:hypothetical protein
LQRCHRPPSQCFPPLPTTGWTSRSLGGHSSRASDRSGTYQALLDAAKPTLAGRRTVVIYPAGTRSRDGSVVAFQSGALRLARDCDAPLIPIALVGTGEVLPKNGGFAPARCRSGSATRSMYTASMPLSCGSTSSCCVTTY